MRICTIVGCEVKYWAKGYCRNHYEKFRRYGNALIQKREQHKSSYSEEYNTWSNMKERCYRKNDIGFKNYGGRGIKVCDRWLHSFTNFLKDMGKRPFPKAQIDRIDNDGNYEPSNCRWVTIAKNSQNKRNNVLNIHTVKSARRVYMLGKYTLRELALIYNININTLTSAIYNYSWKDVL